MTLDTIHTTHKIKKSRSLLHIYYFRTSIHRLLCWLTTTRNLTILMYHQYSLLFKEKCWNCKEWLTAQMSYIMLPAVPHISKYMWLMFCFFFKFVSFSIIQSVYDGQIQAHNGSRTSTGMWTTVWETVV
jgi:hypothetical protein